MKILSVFGTRPEAIKMCPLIQEIEKQNDMESVVCLTGQHREMLLSVLKLFNISPDYNLDIMRQEQTLTSITADILNRVEKVFIEEKPDIVLVHGDTSTSFAAALAAFYQKIPIGHVEAGLRSGDRYSPWPEEMNRRLTARLASIHFSPTKNNSSNLEAEGIRQSVYITGNTVMDAFKTTLKKDYCFHDECLKKLDFNGYRWILLTAHRRENLGKPMEHIFKAVRKAIELYEDIQVIFPMHLNPAVRQCANKVLAGLDRVHLTQPLGVEDMHNLMKRSYLVMTDSGGLQEEAPACGIPVLVLRTETERPEAVDAGTVKIVGVGEEEILNNIQLLLDNKEVYARMAEAVNPYGDGQASKYIVEALRTWWREEKQNGRYE